MAQKILGLDIGAHSIKGLLLEGSSRGAEVIGWESVPLEIPAPPAPVEGEAEAESGEEQAPEDPLVRALAELLGKFGPENKPDTVAVALPGASASSPLLRLPFTEPKKIEATLGFEVEGLLPFDLEDASYDYQVLSQKEGGSDLLVGVVRKEELRELIARLQAAGIDPRIITLPGLALSPILAELAQRGGADPDEEIALLDVGKARGVLTVISGGELAFTRTFTVGADERQVLREIRQSLRAAQSRKRGTITRIHLAGGALDAAALERELRIPVQPVALPGDAGAKIPANEQPLYAQALGLAMRARMRGGPKQLNFRRGEFAFRGDLDYLKGKVSRLAAFAAALILLLAGNFWAQLNSVRSAEKQLDEQLCETTQRVLGTCETNFDVALSKMQGGDTKAAGIPTASAMEVFAEATANLPQEAGVDLTEVEAMLDRFRIRGSVDSFDAVDQVVAGLKKSRCIADVKRGRVQRQAERIEFTVDALYTCGQNAENSATVAGTEG